MTNGRNNGRKRDTSREPGGFVALPWTVLDCPAYSCLSHPAKSLLLEFARQYIRDNNGRLLCSAVYLAKREWKSADVIARAKRELLDAGFIFQTVQGHRPNKASWFAVTWYTLDKLTGYDAGVESTFERGAYQKNRPVKNARLIPSRGVGKALIAPSPGIEKVPLTPSHGAIKDTIDLSPIPSHGNHLEKPSAVQGCKVPQFTQTISSTVSHHTETNDADCTRERDDDKAAEYWDAERGEFVTPTTRKPFNSFENFP